jgi:1,4-alpha-glucan branching enzyme
MEQGYLCLVLHTHLPFVRHPEHNFFLEENWFYEAVIDTYLPLINTFDELEKSHTDFRLTMSLTPTLINMIQDPLLQKRCCRHIKKLIELAQKEIIRTQKYEPEMTANATMYYEKLQKNLFLFAEKYQKNLINAFSKFQKSGKLEIITCAATHGFLPLMQCNESAVRAQISIACDHYKETFQQAPKGIWLPECGYYPGVEKILKEYGLQYFFVDTHGLMHSKPRPKYGLFTPVSCPNGVAVFSRDPESSKSVWSSKEGYPGDYNYRDFYRDIGYDLDFEYIKPYIHPDGIRIFTGLKYYKITGESDHKEPYDREKALAKADEHAGNFIFNRKKQLEHLAPLFSNQKPIIVSPYDTELFGHWWYEGPDWLCFLLKKIHHDQNTLKLITPSEYLAKYPDCQVVEPAMSSWGYKGYSEVWLEQGNDWIYRHLLEIAEKMNALARQNPTPDNLTNRALNQAARELLLAQSSDWAFIMKTKTTVDYAVQRTKTHILNFLNLETQIKNKNLNADFISDLESKNNIFKNIDYKIYK